MGSKHIYIILIFIILGGSIFEKLNNEQILNKIWSYKKKGHVHTDIKTLYKKITDGIIEYSMSMEEKFSDNY